MPHLPTDELVARIKKLRDEKDLNFQQIASELLKQGIKSSKTGKPISSATVRFHYFNKSRPPKSDRTESAILTGNQVAYADAQSVGQSQAEQTLQMIRAALKMKLSDKERLAFIESVLNSK